MIQNLASEAEIPAISFKAERLIRRDSVEPLILQSVGLQLGHETYAPPFLLFVDHESTTFFRDCPESKLQLLSAVAT
jgi:hypothetical protein